MKKLIFGLASLTLMFTACSTIKNNERKIASDERITAAEANAKQKLNDFTNRYAGDSDMLKSIIDAAIANGITQEFGRDTGIPLTDDGIIKLLNSWQFLEKDLKPLQTVVVSGEGMYFDFAAADELAMKMASKRILEIFAEASIDIVKLHVATQYRKDWDRPYKPGFRRNIFVESYQKLNSLFATIDHTLLSAMLACNTVACAKQIYDAQAELLNLGSKINRGYKPDKPNDYSFDFTIMSSLNKEAIRMLSENMPQSNSTEKLYRQALNIFIRPIFADTNIGAFIHRAITVDIPQSIFAGLKVDQAHATLANEIKVWQYTFTRLDYSIIHNVPLSHSPSAFDNKRPFGMLLTCTGEESDIGARRKIEFMAGVYGELATVTCYDIYATEEANAKRWKKTLEKNPTLYIADLADKLLNERREFKRQMYEYTDGKKGQIMKNHLKKMLQMFLVMSRIDRVCILLM